MPDCCLETYTASADATASDTANNGQTVTSSASSTASSTLNYEDAYAVAHSNAKSVAKSVAENNTNIINQSFPGLITLENLKSASNVYNIHDNSNYYYIKGSKGNSTTMPPAFFSLGAFVILAAAVDSKGNLYVGGSSSTVIADPDGLNNNNGLSTIFNSIAKWDGNSWSPLGDGLNGQVNAIAIDKSDNVYVGGKFTTLRDNITSMNYVSKWTPSTSTWSPLGTSAINGVLGGGPNFVKALAVDASNNVYVGGDFTSLSTVTATNSTNTAVTNSAIVAFTAESAVSLTASMFVFINGQTIPGLKISTVTNQQNIVLNIPVTILAGTTISFSYTEANNIAKWTPSTSTWSVLGAATTNGTGNKVNALAIDSSNNVYVGGDFIALGDTVHAFRIAKWMLGTATWQVLGTTALNGVNNDVYAIAIDSSNNVYVGGAFTTIYDNSTTASQTVANKIAKWTLSTTTWSVLGGVTTNGLQNSVNALAIDSSNNVYASGAFTRLGDKTSANYIAKWTPAGSGSWSTVGASNNTKPNKLTGTKSNGLPDTSSAIAIYKSTNTLYAGDSTDVYELFSDYVNLQYNGVTIVQLHQDGQIVTVYANNKNGKKACAVIKPTTIYQNYF